MNHPLLILTAVFPLLVIVAAMKDITTYTIPNWISAALVAAFFPVALALGAPLPVIGTCLLIGLAALLIGMAMFALNWIGGGDAKLLAAAALWVGWPAVLPFVLVTAVAGGALALILLQMRSSLLRPWFVRAPPWLARLATDGGDAPYGVAICVGALFILPQSVLFRLG
jgi:prepilin peptidase CpaA